MSLDEFQLIERYFAAAGALRDDVVVGIGDDAALLRVPPGRVLVSAVDTLIEGVHFPPGCVAGAIGHRALAVNLSDLAAMGAEPAWMTLALTLPQADEEWLQGFADGLSALALEFNVALVGGDTTRGPLSISLQAMGTIVAGSALRRSGAQPGDILCLSGTAGDAAAGLEIAAAPASTSDENAVAERAWLRERFLRPQPRVAEGASLRSIATAAIDVSDGLLADAGRLTAASHVGAELQLDALPLSPALRHCVGAEQARTLALTGGDDYELLFTVPQDRWDGLQAAAQHWSCGCSRIGVITREPGLRATVDGGETDLPNGGYRHF